jgi:putative transposase
MSGLAVTVDGAPDYPPMPGRLIDTNFDVKSLPETFFSASELAGHPGQPLNRNNFGRHWESKGIRTRSVVRNGNETRVVSSAKLPLETIQSLWRSGAFQNTGAQPKVRYDITLKQVALSRAVSVQGIDTEKLKSQGFHLEDLKTAKIDIYRAYQRLLQIPGTCSAEDFIALYNARKIPEISPTSYALVRNISHRTIRRWIQQKEQFGVDALQDGRAARAGRTLIEVGSPVYDCIVGEIVGNMFLRVAQIYKFLIYRFPSTMVSKRTVERFVKGFLKENEPWLLRRQDPPAYFNRFMPATGQHIYTYTGEECQGDSTPFNIQTSDGIRFPIVGYIDVATRMVTCRDVKSSDAASVAEVFRIHVTQFGRPEKLKLDNGKDYASQHLAQVAQDLGISIRHCPPRQPWGKPFIERFFGTLATHMESAPGWIGASVDQRKKIEAHHLFTKVREGDGAEYLKTRMTRSELSLWLRDAIHQYHNTVHSDLECTPLQKWEALKESAVYLDCDEEELDLIFAPGGVRGFRKVTATGISFNNSRYASEELLIQRLNQPVRVSLHSTEGKATTSAILVRFGDSKAMIVPRVARGVEGIANARAIKKGTDQHAKVWNAERFRLHATNEQLKELWRVEREHEQIKAQVASIEEAAIRKLSASKTTIAITAIKGRAQKNEMVESYNHGTPAQRQLLDAIADGSSNTSVFISPKDRMKERIARFGRLMDSRMPGQPLSDDDTNFIRQFTDFKEFKKACLAFPELMEPYKDLGLAVVNG